MKRVIFLIAPPAGGKTTVAKGLSDKNFKVVETSEAIREYAKNDRRLLEYVEERMQSGHLVSSAVVDPAIAQRLEEHLNHRTEVNLVVPGLPRTLEQVKFALDHSKEKRYDPWFVFIELSDDESTRRFFSRGHHGRLDHNEKIHKKRLHKYREKVNQIQDYLRRKAPSRILVVDGSHNEETVLMTVCHGVLG